MERLSVVVESVDGRKWNVSVARGARVADVLAAIGIGVDEVIVTVNGEVVSEDEKVRDGDRLTIFWVASGG